MSSTARRTRLQLGCLGWPALTAPSSCRLLHPATSLCQTRGTSESRHSSAWVPSGEKSGSSQGYEVLGYNVIRLDSARGGAVQSRRVKMETLLIALECLKAGRHLYSPVINPQEIAPLLLMLARIITWYHKLTPREPSYADTALFFFLSPF